jgi:hypothetical protein
MGGCIRELGARQRRQRRFRQVVVVGAGKLLPLVALLLLVGRRLIDLMDGPVTAATMRL